MMLLVSLDLHGGKSTPQQFVPEASSMGRTKHFEHIC